jgi:hypothetical protein
MAAPTTSAPARAWDTSREYRVGLGGDCCHWNSCVYARLRRGEWGPHPWESPSRRVGGTTARMLEILGIRTGVVEELDSDDEFDTEVTHVE